MSEYYVLDGKIELYDVEKFKDWLFEELQKQEFVGTFDIGINKETKNDKKRRNVSMTTFELYFSDLTPNAQKRFLEFVGIETPEDGNFDFFPIYVMERYPEDEI